MILLIVLLEELVYLSVQEYPLLQVDRHFLIVPLHKIYDLSQCILLLDILENIRDEQIKDLLRLVQTVTFKNLLFRLTRHVVLSQEITSEPKTFWNIPDHLPVVNRTNSLNMHVLLPLTYTYLLPHPLVQDRILSFSQDVFIRQQFREVLEQFDERAFCCRHDVLKQLFINDPENELK